jgi:hypothetical protein
VVVTKAEQMQHCNEETISRDERRVVISMQGSGGARGTVCVRVRVWERACKAGKAACVCVQGGAGGCC